VMDHQHAVARAVHVQFDTIHPEIERPLKGGQGIFEECARGAAVGNERRSGARGRLRRDWHTAKVAPRSAAVNGTGAGVRLNASSHRPSNRPNV